MLRSNRWLWLVIGAITLLFSGHVAQTTPPSPRPVAAVLTTPSSELLIAERARDRGNYEQAIVLVDRFISGQLRSPLAHRNLLSALDLAGELFLRRIQSPDRAILFFHKIGLTSDLYDAEMVAVEEWLGAAQDLQRFPGKPSLAAQPDYAYEQGTSYYLVGLRQKEDTNERAAKRYFTRALGWLVPYTYQHPDHEHVSSALLQIAEMRRHATSFEDFWIENFYLKEVIRHFPHSDSAQQAFVRLNEAVHAGYSGSSGDHTPPDMLRMLQYFEVLAQPTGSS